MSDSDPNEVLLGLADLLAGSAGEVFVWRTGVEPTPHARRLMDSLGVRIEVVKMPEPVPTYCPHKGCHWSVAVTSKVRAEGFLLSHLKYNHKGADPRPAPAPEPPARPAVPRAIMRPSVEQTREPIARPVTLGPTSTSVPQESPDVDIERDILAVEIVEEPVVEPKEEDMRVDIDRYARDRVWTREEVRAAMVAHHAATGRPPRSDDWRKKTAEHPNYQGVCSVYGSWRAALADCGFSVGRNGRTAAAAPQEAPAAVEEPVAAVEEPDAPEPEETHAGVSAELVLGEQALRDPIPTSALTLSPDLLEDEAAYLRRRAEALDALATGARKLLAA